MMLLTLMLEFFKIGLFAVGGGLATIPFLKELSLKYGWYSLEMLQTMINISESTPGPIGVNMATYVGYETCGIIGAIAATLSLVAPSVIVVLIIARILKQFKESKIVKDVFVGMKPAVFGLIIYAVYDIFVRTLLNVNTIINLKETIMYVMFVYAVFKYKKLHPIAVIVMCAILGIILGL